MPQASPPPRDRQIVTALSRGLALLSCFRADRPLLTNADLARATALPKSSVSRLTHTLVKDGYLEYDTLTASYRLGARVLSLSHALSGGLQLRQRVAPFLHALAQASRSHASLATCESHSMLILEVVSGDGTRALPMEIGAHMTLEATAMGRAYIASCSPAERERIAQHLVAQRGRDESALRQVVAQAIGEYRALGYCTSVHGWRKGVTGVAAPLFLKNLGRRIVLTCGGVEPQMSAADIRDRIGPLLLRSAQGIEQACAALNHF